jgi:hypothetical protein
LTPERTPLNHGRGVTPDPREKNAKLARGCGGCGCALGLLTFIGGVVLIAFGTQPATTEAMPFGVITTGLSLPIGLIALVLLIWGLSTLGKIRKGT